MYIYGIDQYSTKIDPMLDATPAKAQTNKAAKMTVVYGVNTEDYLPLKEVARRHLRPGLRSSISHPTFNLPDAFYYIGGPVFLLIFLRVLVIFLNGFEEKRKE